LLAKSAHNVEDNLLRDRLQSMGKITMAIA